MAKVPTDQHSFNTYQLLIQEALGGDVTLLKGVVMKPNLFFPSGRSFERCRQDAKAHVKQSKQTNSPINLNVALDIVASQNGIDLPWSKAIKKIKIETENKIKMIVDQTPYLTYFGIGLFDNGRGLKPSEYVNKMIEGRQKLINSTEEFAKTCKWLEQIDKIKTINRKHSSYSLKHIAEKKIGYISNGVLIAAAIHCGFDAKITPGQPNVNFNMSEKSIKKL